MGSLPRDMLIVGGDSSLGVSVASLLEESGRSAYLTTRRPERTGGNVLHLDLGQSSCNGFSIPEEVRSALLLAGETSTDVCRRFPERTRRINVENMLSVAARLMARGVFVVFASTNAVFDGSHPHVPRHHPVSPATEYGRQKAFVEAELAKMGPSVAIVRLSKVLKPGMPLFQGWKTRLMRGERITPFKDMVFSPIPLAVASKLMVHVAEKRLPGVWQCSAREDVSYTDAAYVMADTLGLGGDLVSPVVSHDVLDAAEHVPANTTLESSDSYSALDLSPVPVADVVREVCLVQ